MLILEVLSEPAFITVEPLMLLKLEAFKAEINTFEFVTLVFASLTVTLMFLPFKLAVTSLPLFCADKTFFIRLPCFSPKSAFIDN